ncbi:MAG: DUF1697 domain-containing protein [bacterium]
MTRWVALLYSVVLTQQRRVTSAQLLQLANDLGLAAPKTVLSTGNLIFDAKGDEDGLSDLIERQIAHDWARPIAVLLRSSSDFVNLLATNPFPTHDPAKVAVRLMRYPPSTDHQTRLAALGNPAEAFAPLDRDLWIATKDHLSTSAMMRAIASPKLGIGTFRSASALTKIAMALAN